MRYLVEHEGEIVSRKDLLEKVWNIQGEVETRTVDNFILRLRKFFEPNPSKSKYRRSIRC
ncbi:MAG: helix-turn-helix domain-containing protein, partial [bacterium]